MTARAVLLLALAWTLPACASLNRTVPSRPGIWPLTDLRHALSAPAADTLLSSLRRITGLAGLGFDAQGRLGLTSPETRGGSPLAASLLREALDSGDTYVLEEYSGSGAVTFGQIEPVDYSTALGGSRLRVWRVRLDFEDFRGLSGPSRVREAFDPGFVLLHELLHARGCHDDDSRHAGLGACEAVLNDVRAELGLPRRAAYAAQWLWAQDRGPQRARMLFVDEDEAGVRRGLASSLIFAPGVSGPWTSRPPSSAPGGGSPSTGGRRRGTGPR